MQHAQQQEQQQEQPHAQQEQQQSAIMDRLTQVIDAYQNQDWGTDADIKATLWPEMHYIYENRNNMSCLEEWKYYKAYAAAERSHSNGQKPFELLTWESSFALTLLFNVYH